MSDLRRFLERLYRDCTGGVVECRALPSKQRAWANVGDWKPFGSFLNAQIAARQDVYFGVCTRRDSLNGTTENLLEMPAVWCDLDVLDEDADRRLAAFPFRVSILNRSGLHSQPYWILREPLDLREPHNVHRAASVLRRLCLALGGDDRATDPARTLRPPATFNFKYDSPRLVTLATMTDATVDLTELEDMLPAEVIVKNEWTIEGIPEGQRNDRLHAHGRALRVQGRSLPEIFRELEAVNAQWCRPPVDSDELKRIVHSVWVQKDRSDFIPPVVIHDATPPPPAPDGTAIFVNLGSVKAEAVTWHWSKRLAAGKGVMLAGDPGTGKSMITTSLAAMSTTGGDWPDGGAAPKGKVLWLCAEDGLADTVRPRVDAHHGDASMVEVLTAVQDKQSERPFNLSKDIAILEEGLRRFQPKLIVIDPLNSYLGRVDSYRDADIRGVLSPLLACIEKYGCALIWVSHLTKNDEAKALYRPGASIGFIASARMALIVGEHPQQPGTMVLAQSKNNLAPKDVSLTFQVTDGIVRWGGAVDLTADAILQTPDPEEVEMDWTADGFIAVLRKESATGSIDVKDANARAALIGIPDRTLRAAARRVNLTPYSRGKGKEHRGYWFDPQHIGHGSRTEPTAHDITDAADIASSRGAAAMLATAAMTRAVGTNAGNGNGRKEETDGSVSALPDSNRNGQDRTEQENEHE